MREPTLELKGISKSFPGVKALDEVSFKVYPGTVHAICGENGAGKSTLMKIINGIHQPDTGSLEIGGKPVHVKNPIEARDLGVAMISQELNYVPDLTIAENFFIGQLPMKNGKIDWRRIRREARKLLEDEGLDYSTRRRLGSLTVSEIQTLEILRAVYHSADIVIMDEPTSAIAHKEVESLFEKIRQLRSEGKSILYISHKMDEVFELADDITVIRDGKMVSSRPASETSRQQVIAEMVGRDMDESAYPSKDIELGEVILETHGLSRDLMFEDIDINVRAGEIVGIAGLIGAGRSEVVRSIFGLDAHDAGVVELKGKDVNLRNPGAALKNGVAMLSEDRRLVGIIPQMSIKKNATLASLKKVIYSGWTHKKVEDELAAEYFQKMAVKAPNHETKIASLSGGNQQKVLLARCLIADPTVLLLDEPTRGIDVGAKFEIYGIMMDLAKQGKAIVMISSELPELIGVCDRIYVMSGGRVTAELTRDQFVARISNIVLPHDYITWRLTGKFVTDRSEASGTGYFDSGANRYLIDMLEEVFGNILPWDTVFPEVLGPDDVAGYVRSNEIGLPEGIPVAVGGGDQHVAALGLGVGTGDVVFSLGTSGVVITSSEQPVYDQTGMVDGVANAIGGWLPLVCTLNSTKVTDWAAELLGVSVQGLDKLALEAKVDEMPYFAAFVDGERSPSLPNAAALMAGLTGAVGRPEFAASFFFGVLMGLLRGYDAIEASGVPVDGRVIAIGGGARSPAFTQILADLLGRPVEVISEPEATARGASVQALAVLRGVNVEELSQKLAPAVKRTVFPRVVEPLWPVLRPKYLKTAELAEMIDR